MKFIQRHRDAWIGKTDEWIFERMDKELKDKVSEIHTLLDRVKELENMICDCQDYDSGLVSNSCKIHNDNPIVLENDWN